MRRGSGREVVVVERESRGGLWKMGERFGLGLGFKERESDTVKNSTDSANDYDGHTANE
ncbi:unnamed protein product [Dovyalis caffra]|uniref:Uncharacterized protein n=1 Tax=Dovyalis caffra TaxID=77055 RepID=A0AAV1RZG8_9ROSI|nr:unnamed protein product [Dovyalis caffra]